MASSTDICIVRFQNALLEPLHIRCLEIARIVDDFSSKELHSIYPILVGDIFGISNQIGWGLRRSFKNYQPLEYVRHLEFFHPEGTFFKMCYKLMATNLYLKYDFPLSCLPASVKSMIDDGMVPAFYSDYLRIDPQTGSPAALQLNAFELFLFHFAHHLVRSGAGPGELVDLWDTAYLQLASDYSHYFLRCDGTPVPPVPGYYMSRPNVSVQPTHRTPVRMPTLFRQSVYNTSLGTSGAASGTACHMELWRSELLAQVFVDYWLDVSPNQSRISQNQSRMNQSGCGLGMSQQYPQLASLEHIRVVRNLLKHLHYLTNSCTGDGSTMDEFKRLLLPGSRAKIHSFLRRTIDQWPLDSSFRLILETWLSFIQPWRYTDYRHNEDRILVVDRSWRSFLADNLLSYTVIFGQVINRLARLDLIMPKNVNMLARLVKVFSQDNLCEMLVDVERGAVDSTNHKFSAVFQQQLLELEPPGFSYIPMFSQLMLTKVSHFIRLVCDAQQRAQEYLQQEELKLAMNPTSLFSRFCSIFWSPKDTGDYTIDDRRKAFMQLGIALDNLAVIFHLERMDLPTLGNLDYSLLLSEGDLSSEEQSFQAQEMTPRLMQERRRKVRYEGDPDLQPIRSWENTLLVRLLHQLATKVNEMYGHEMSECYHRRDWVGRLARQVLHGPRMVRYYNRSRRVESSLPPRLSLRSFASHRLLIYFLVMASLCYYFFGLGPMVFTVLLMVCWAVLLLARAGLESWTQQ